MFAFNTDTNQKNCGISQNESNDMKITALKEPITISTNEMGYNHGRPNVRQYDSCFYQIEASDPLNTEIQLTVTKAKEMNVYLYGGLSRSNATLPIVEGNMQVELEKTYSTNSTNGLLLIAYPNYDVATEFEFNYQLVKKPLPPSPEPEPVVIEQPQEPTVIEEPEIVEDPSDEEIVVDEE